MDFSSALPTFVVTLREGVEATLVVGIVLAYLKKAQQSQLNAWVYGGVLSGLLVSVGVGGLLHWAVVSVEAANQQSAAVIQPLLKVVFTLLAIGFLSWMLIWMTQQARGLKAEVEGAIGDKLQQAGTQADWGIWGLIFVAVVREGFETVLFLTAQFQQGWPMLLGVLGGLTSAAIVGVLLFQLGVKINLRQFFQVMGVLLLLIVGGLVISVLGNFDKLIAALAQINPAWASLCFSHNALGQASSCLLGPLVWNVRSVLPDSRFPGLVLKTLFGYRDQLYLMQAIGYGVFWLTVGTAYFRSLGHATTATATPSQSRAL